jgi:hypothetical protein
MESLTIVFVMGGQAREYCMGVLMNDTSHDSRAMLGIDREHCAVQLFRTGFSNKIYLFRTGSDFNRSLNYLMCYFE